MTIIARSTREDTIFLPERLFTLLKLREGDAVKAVIEGQTLRVARLEAFLSLRVVCWPTTKHLMQRWKTSSRDGATLALSLHLHRHRPLDCLSEKVVHPGATCVSNVPVRELDRFVTVITAYELLFGVARRVPPNRRGRSAGSHARPCRWRSRPLAVARSFTTN